jgi:Ras-related protein Rab-6A
MYSANESQNESLKFKLIVVGDQNTGKSCILNRFANEIFEENYQATIGLDFLNKTVNINGQEIHLVLYDTAGQEKFRSLIPMYIREAQIILLIYDITSKDSFESIPKWFSDILNVKNDEAIFALVGNKIDLNDKRVVSFEEGKKLANEKNIIFEEVSAKDGQNFNELFTNKLFNELYKKFKNKFDNNRRKKEPINNEYIEDNEISNNTNVKLELDGNTINAKININYQKKKKKNVAN